MTPVTSTRAWISFGRWRGYHESIIYFAADLRVDEFAGHHRAFSHDACPPSGCQEFSRTHDAHRRGIFCRLALFGVLVASTPAADVAATVVQQAFDGGQHSLCSGSFGFCHWLSTTTLHLILDTSEAEE